MMTPVQVFQYITWIGGGIAVAVFLVGFAVWLVSQFWD